MTRAVIAILCAALVAGCGQKEEEPATDLSSRTAVPTEAPDVEETAPAEDASAAAEPAEEAPAAEPAEEAAPAETEATPEQTQPAEEDEGTMVTTDSGQQYIDIEVGDGDEAESGDTVEVHYTGTLEDGTKFDSSKDRGVPFEFPLGPVA